MQSNKAISLMYALPQLSFLNDDKIDRFLKKLAYLQEDPEWHARRMAGFGGSEVGTLLRERHGSFTNAPGDSFKTADQVVAEKLLHRLPMPPTIQCKRGTSIEPLTRAAFIKKTNARRFDEAFGAARAHRTIKPMLGNIDDGLYIGSRTVLVDYKSSQQPYQQLPFDYLAQNNHYAAIAKSNGVTFDKGVVVGIHAPEAMLQGLAAISDNRDNDMETFEFWADLIAKDKVPALTLKVYQCPLNDKLMSLCESVVQSRWDEFVMQGKLLIPEKSLQLSENNLVVVEKLMQDATNMMALQKITTQRLEDTNASICNLLQGVNTKTLPFINKHPINISSRSTFDKEAALSALAAEGVESKDIPSSSTNYDTNMLIHELQRFQPDIDTEQYKIKTPTVPGIRGALKNAGLDQSLFEATKHSFTPSKSKAKAEAFEEVVNQHEATLSMT